MYKGKFTHDHYMHSRMIRRMEIKKLDLDLKVTFALQMEPYVDTWEAIYKWLAANKIVHFTHSPFTTEYRRYFSFVEPKDAMMFKLVWHNAPANGWKRSS